MLRSDAESWLLSVGSVTESWAQSTIVKGMITDDDEPVGSAGS